MYFDPLDDVDELLKPSTRTVVIDVFKGTGHVGISLRNTECGEGVLVTHVHPRDLACQAGLRAGDIILALNGNAVYEHEDAIAMVQKTGATSSGELVVEYRTAEQVAFSKAAAARMAKADKALTGSPMAQRALKFVAVSLLSG